MQRPKAHLTQGKADLTGTMEETIKMAVGTGTSTVVTEAVLMVKGTKEGILIAVGTMSTMGRERSTLRTTIDEEMRTTKGTEVVHQVRLVTAESTTAIAVSLRIMDTEVSPFMGFPVTVLEGVLRDTELAEVRSEARPPASAGAQLMTMTSADMDQEAQSTMTLTKSQRLRVQDGLGFMGRRVRAKPRELTRLKEPEDSAISSVGPGVGSRGS